MTQPRPRERCLPQLPSALGVKQMHQTYQELIRRQGNKPERKYKDLLPGTPVYAQHKPNARWETATVVCKADALNFYWITYENRTQQPKTYRCTCTAFKIRSTPNEGEQKAQMEIMEATNRFQLISAASYSLCLRRSKCVQFYG